MKNMIDERVEEERHAIHSYAFGIAILGLWLIIAIRFIILEQDIMELIDIFGLTILLSTYVLIQMIRKGHYIPSVQGNNKKRILWLGGIIGAIVFTVIQFFSNNFKIKDIQDVLRILVSLILFIVVWVFIQLLFMRLSQKQADKIE
jgi:Kef-type K+ transport system membrane component KefB